MSAEVDLVGVIISVMPELKSVMTTSNTKLERTLIVKVTYGISKHAMLKRLLSCFMILTNLNCLISTESQ
jgi:hypothetical protein